MMRRILILLLAAAMLAPVLLPRDASAADGKWEYVDRFDGVKVWRMSRAGSNVMAFRGVVVKPIHIGRVLTTFATSKYHKDWVDRWDNSRDLKKIASYERVFWIRFDLPWPVSDRDYVIHTKATPNEKKRQVIARLKSVNHPAKPTKGGCCVRRMAFGTQYRITALPGGKTRMMVEVHTDPRGMLPSWLVNMIQKKWPSKTLNGLARRAGKSDIGVYKGFEDWHTPYKAPPPLVAAPAPVAPVAVGK